MRRKEFKEVMREEKWTEGIKKLGTIFKERNEWRKITGMKR